MEEGDQPIQALGMAERKKVGLESMKQAVHKQRWRVCCVQGTALVGGGVHSED